MQKTDKEENFASWSIMTRRSTIDSLNAVTDMELQELRQKTGKEDGEEQILGRWSTPDSANENEAMELKLRRSSTNAALKLVEAYELEEDREKEDGDEQILGRETIA